MPDHVFTTVAFGLALEAAPTGMMLVDEIGRIVLINTQVETLFGYDRRELVGRAMDVLVPDGVGAGTHEAVGRHHDGRALPIELAHNPLDTPDGRFVLTSIIDLGERKRAEREREELLGQLQQLNSELEARVASRTRELTATVKEREALLQEVHHRVKNNLQVVSSLINMQVRKLPAGAAASRDALRECQRRVEAIALIHEQLYRSRNYGRIPFSDYVRSLAANVLEATGVSPELVTLELAIEDVALAVDLAIPCGLVINELITNALKHAFPDGRAGRVRVELARGRAGLVLAVADDGVGLPAGFALTTSSSMGLQLVQTLAEQLHARLDLGEPPGARFQLAFQERT